MTDMDRGKDYEPDIYATHEDDYEDFDVEEEEERGSRAAFVLLLVIGAVVLLCVGYGSYRIGYENGQRVAEVPRLQAAAGGKVEPADPGGLAPPEKSELDEGITGTGEEDFAQLLPSEEPVIEVPAKNSSEPVPGIEIPDTIGADPDSMASGPGEGPDSIPVETPAPPKPAAPKATSAPSSGNSSRIMVPKPGEMPPAVAAVSAPQPSSSGAKAPKRIPVPSVSEPEPEPTVPSPGPTVPPATVSAPAPSAGPNGEYVVQLASLPSQEAADAAWRTTSAKFPDLLGAAIRDIEEADLGERGLFYRLRVGYFQSRTDANRLCETLKARGQDCLVKTR